MEAPLLSRKAGFPLRSNPRSTAAGQNLRGMCPLSRFVFLF